MIIESLFLNGPFTRLIMTISENARLDRILNDLCYAVNECRDDLKSLCADIEPGESRLLECLTRNAEKVSTRCNTALEDVGYKK